MKKILTTSAAVLAIDSWTVEEFVAASEKDLHAASGARDEKLRHMGLLANSDVDCHPGVGDLNGRLLANLAVVGHDNSYFMATPAQLAR